EPSLNHRIGIESAIAKPTLELKAIRRKNKNAGGIMNFRFDLCCALNVNIQQEVAPALLCAMQKACSRSVVVAENVGVFQKFAFGDHGLELFAGNEKILFAVLFFSARLPGSVGN